MGIGTLQQTGVRGYNWYRVLSFKLGIIAALPFEVACFTNKKINPGDYQVIAQNIFVYAAGMGFDNATQAVQTLINSNIDAFVSWGVAGALDTSLVSGDIVLPESVIDNNEQQYNVDARWHAVLKNKLKQDSVISAGSIVSTQNLQHNPQLKSKLHQSSQAIAIDMESAAIARAASQANKPFVIIRSIFDTASMSLPQSSTNATDQYGKVSIPKLISGLIQSPGELLQYPNLISSFTKAKNSLMHVVELCGNDLCFAEAL